MACLDVPPHDVSATTLSSVIIAPLAEPSLPCHRNPAGWYVEEKRLSAKSCSTKRGADSWKDVVADL
ncbi:hypothetical protein AAHA92_16757 [Salvia divinorum]|uniref:Uncharacterized protein n=1 Tax=Salvia divinorum TaxID=28513 RepID=A0ABD1GZI7_SALDI